MEKAALEAAGYVYAADGTAHCLVPLEPSRVSPRVAALLTGLSAMSPSGPSGSGAARMISMLVQTRLRILKRFPFSSELKRSAVVVDVDVSLVGGAAATRPDLQLAVQQAAAVDGACGRMVLVKGSPEAIRPMLANVPEGYDAAYVHLARSGKRVLSLATKRLEPRGGGRLMHSVAAHALAEPVAREEAERALTFCGFLVLHCPPRPESAEMLTGKCATALANAWLPLHEAPTQSLLNRVALTRGL